LVAELGLTAEGRDEEGSGCVCCACANGREDGLANCRDASSFAAGCPFGPLSQRLEGPDSRLSMDAGAGGSV